MTMLNATEAKDIVKRDVSDIQYIDSIIQCRITEAAMNGDSRCMVYINTRPSKSKSKRQTLAEEVITCLKNNGYEAEYNIDADDENYLRFDISWED